MRLGVLTARRCKAQHLDPSDDLHAGSQSRDRGGAELPHLLRSPRRNPKFSGNRPPGFGVTPQLAP